MSSVQLISIVNVQLKKYRQCDCKLRLYKVKITNATNNCKGAKRLKESVA